MSEQENGNELRGSGLQSFVMSLTGLEAFANTYFHIRGNELGSAAIYLVQMPEIILIWQLPTQLNCIVHAGVLCTALDRRKPRSIVLKAFRGPIAGST